ncbi:hypothetical protein [Prosthecomicrobium sp. N25]|uniref:hypothetical protein n=1 Tax=Prosthecomicrobium sp. N25 TaxID=3129254 RepID=UPI0030771EBB
MSAAVGGFCGVTVRIWIFLIVVLCGAALPVGAVVLGLSSPGGAALTYLIHVLVLYTSYVIGAAVAVWLDRRYPVEPKDGPAGPREGSPGASRPH